MTRILTFLAFAVLYLIGAAVLLVWMAVWLVPSILLLELRWAVHGKPEGAEVRGYLPKWTTGRQWDVALDKDAWIRDFKEVDGGLARRAGGLHQ